MIKISALYRFFLLCGVFLRAVRPPLRCGTEPGTRQFFPEPIRSALPGLYEDRDDLVPVFRLVVLEEYALHMLFLKGFWDIDLLHRLRVEAGIVHGGRERARRGVKILHLFRAHIVALEEYGELYCVVYCTAGMRGHEVRYEILLFSCAFGRLIEILFEF